MRDKVVFFFAFLPIGNTVYPLSNCDRVFVCAFSELREIKFSVKSRVASLHVPMESIGTQTGAVPDKIMSIYAPAMPPQVTPIFLQLLKLLDVEVSFVLIAFNEYS